MDNLNPLDHEKYLLKLLLTDAESRDKIYSFVNPVYFDEEFSHNKIVELFQKYRERYNAFASPAELLQMCDNETVFNAIKNVIAYDTSDFKQEFLEEETAEFFRKKMLMTNIFTIADTLKRNEDTSKLNDFPDKLREALSFSFDTRVGLDFFEDGDRLYDSMHLNDNVISTGLRDIDKMIKGGFHEKTLSLLIAGTNVGKSLTKCALAANAILQNKNALYITFEMSEEKISERILANILDVTLESLFAMKKENLIRKLNEAKQKVKGKLIVKEYPTSGANTNTIRALLKELRIKKNFVPDIIFVDYLGIMLSNSKAENANTNTIFKLISQDLRGLAVETGIPIVSSNQTNRGGLNVSDFELTEVADSIGQTMTADIIIGITQTEELAQSNLYSFKILKNRYGGRFGRALVGVDFTKMKLYDVSQEDGSFNEVVNVSQTDLDAASKIVDSTVGSDRIARRNKIIDFD